MRVAMAVLFLCLSWLPGWHLILCSSRIAVPMQLAALAVSSCCVVKPVVERGVGLLLAWLKFCLWSAATTHSQTVR